MEETGLLRLVTGNNCEAQGCIELAVWRLSFKGDTSHFCAKHTRVQMRDPGRKGNF
jgi:hypothetical protein